MEIVGLATVIGTAISGGSLLLQALPFLQLKGQYESLRNALQGIRSPQDERNQSVYGNEADWLELVKWLDRGEIIVNPVRRRVLRRTVIAAAAIVTLIVTSLYDLPNVPSITGKVGAIEWPDLVALVLAAIGPHLAFFKNWLLSDDEAKFLSNLDDLEKAFYRREVAPRLEVFNAVFARKFSHVAGSSADEFVVLRNELDALNRRVAELSAKQDLARVGQASNSDGAQSNSAIDGNGASGGRPNSTLSDRSPGSEQRRHSL